MLDLYRAGIADVSFRRNAENLTYLDFTYRPVNNLTALQIGKGMKVLVLLRSCSKVSSIELVRAMTALEKLGLAGTCVKGLAPLANGARLIKLNASRLSGVRSVAPRAGMTAVENLQFRSTSVKEITPLSNCVQIKNTNFGELQRVFLLHFFSCFAVCPNYD